MMYWIVTLNMPYTNQVEKKDTFFYLFFYKLILLA